MSLHIVLYQPEIPPNTGNIIRLCANTGAQLHIVGPAGFILDDKRLRRAGLDYHEFANVAEWGSLDDYLAAHPERRIIAVETNGTVLHAHFSYRAGDALLFGPETRGLPTEITSAPFVAQTVRLPMLADSRSLNLSNCVAVVVYEAWRQMDFTNGS